MFSDTVKAENATVEVVGAVTAEIKVVLGVASLRTVGIMLVIIAG